MNREDLLKEWFELFPTSYIPKEASYIYNLNAFICYEFSKDYLVIHAVYTKEKRKGIGTLLINEARKIVIDKGLKGIVLEVQSENIDAMAFYYSLGFKEKAKIMVL